jgi:CHASE2 domain-containing sensor protein
LTRSGLPGAFGSNDAQAESRTRLWGAAVAALSLFDAPPRANLRNLAFDAYQRCRPRAQVDDLPMRVIYIDDESIRREGDRRTYRAIGEARRN